METLTDKELYKLQVEDKACTICEHVEKLLDGGDYNMPPICRECVDKKNWVEDK